eukprot:365738-Chlamydomonas_euryale.AAC.13
MATGRAALRRLSRRSNGCAAFMQSRRLKWLLVVAALIILFCGVGLRGSGRQATRPSAKTDLRLEQQPKQVQQVSRDVLKETADIDHYEKDLGDLSSSMFTMFDIAEGKCVNCHAGGAAMLPWSVGLKVIIRQPPGCYYHGLHSCIVGVLTGHAEPNTQRMLSAMAVLHKMGFHVDLFVLPTNPCQSATCLVAISDRVGVPIDPEKVVVAPVPSTGPTGYRVFVGIGNETHPSFSGLGQVNLYMLQYPFALPIEAPNDELNQGMLSYDNYILETSFTTAEFNTAITPTLFHLVDNGKVFPQFDTLSPWVPMLQPGPDGTTTRRVNIVVFGDFSANYMSAFDHILTMFKDLIPRLPATSKLLILGQVIGKHPGVMTDLRNKAQAAGIDDRVLVQSIILNNVDNVLSESLRSALVQLHVGDLRLRLQDDNTERTPGFNPDIALGRLTLACISVKHRACLAALSLSL